MPDYKQYRSTTPIFETDTSGQSADMFRRRMAQIEALASQQEEEAAARQTEPVAPSSEPAYDFGTQEPTSAQAQGSVLPGNVPITQEFGRYNPALEPNKSGRNWGVDFGVKEGTPLALPPGEWQVLQTFDKSSGRGRVGNRENAGYGNSVLVMNPKTGETMRFSHLQGVNVQPGQSLKGGTVIGKSGATGNVTGPHLDLEYKVNGQFRDVTKSPYAQYLFGQGGGKPSNGMGGGMSELKNKIASLFANVKPLNEQIQTMQNMPIDEIQRQAMSLAMAGTTDPLSKSLAAEMAAAKPIARKVVPEVLPELQKAMTNNLMKFRRVLKPWGGPMEEAMTRQLNRSTQMMPILKKWVD